MSVKIYLNLLVLYCVLFQGSIGTLSENDNDESLEHLVRQKRVINRARSGDIRQLVRDVPYIVFIRRIRQEIQCPGTILSSHIVITVPKCVDLVNSVYRVYSGTSRLVLNGPYRSHTIIAKETLKGLHPYREDDGISLITVYPPFDFTASAAQSIFLYQGTLHPGTLATVSGWGCHEGDNPGTNHPQHLRSIHVPIITLQQCANIYQRIFPITEADICTLDLSGFQYCTENDAGAPLVVEMHRVFYLVGIHLWNGGVAGRMNPDVFINLQDPRYKLWIEENLRIMEENASRHYPRNHA